MRAVRWHVLCTRTAQEPHTHHQQQLEQWLTALATTKKITHLGFARLPARLSGRLGFQGHTGGNAIAFEAFFRPSRQNWENPHFYSLRCFLPGISTLKLIFHYNSKSERTELPLRTGKVGLKLSHHG